MEEAKDTPGSSTSVMEPPPITPNVEPPSAIITPNDSKLSLPESETASESTISTDEMSSPLSPRRLAAATLQRANEAAAAAGKLRRASSARLTEAAAAAGKLRRASGERLRASVKEIVQNSNRQVVQTRLKSVRDSVVRDSAAVYNRTREQSAALYVQTEQRLREERKISAAQLYLLTAGTWLLVLVVASYVIVQVLKLLARIEAPLRGPRPSPVGRPPC